MLDLEKALKHLSMSFNGDDLLAYTKKEVPQNPDAASLNSPSHTDSTHYDSASCSTKNTSPAQLIWPAETLPETRYTRERNPRNLEKIEAISSKKITSIEPKRLATKLYALDLYLIKQITAEDLVKYDGKVIPTAIAHLQNNNRGLLALLTAGCSFGYLKKVMSESLKLKNFNLINIAIGATQGRNLSRKEAGKIVYYREMLDSQEGGIFPFEWLLKDCADSNVNVESEIASLRFCKIIDKLKNMKGLESEIHLSEKIKQLVLGRVWKYSQGVLKERNSGEKRTSRLYVLL